VYRLTQRVLIAAPVAIGLFFAPQMLNIYITRVDYLISLPLAILFYCSCVLALDQERPGHALCLGLALAFCAMLKVNGLFFGMFPAFAAIANFRFEKAAIYRRMNFVGLSVSVFLLLLIPLMGRYLFFLSPLGILNHYRTVIFLVGVWAP